MAKYLDETGLAHFWGNIKDSIDAAIPSVNPDTFDGTDYEKLQAAINYAKANDYPAITVGREYDITEHQLDVTKGTSYTDGSLTRRKNLTFIGMGAGCIKKDDSGYIFTATSYSGDYCFINMHFRGSTPEDGCSVFNASMMIRIKTYGCFYDNLKYVFDGTATTIDTTSNMQSINTFGDTATYCGAYAIIRKLWDCSFNGATIEGCTKGFIIDETFDCSINTLNINDCCIESTDGAIDFAISDNTLTLVSLKIQDCYFEANGTNDISIHASYTYNVAIVGNYFASGIASQHCINAYVAAAGWCIGRNDASLASTGVFLYFTDTSNVEVHGEPNTTRGGTESNHPTRLHTSNKLDKFRVGETLNISNFVVSGYVDTNGTRIVCSVPLPKLMPSGLSAAFSFTSANIIGNGTSNYVTSANVTVSTVAINYSQLYLAITLNSLTLSNSYDYCLRISGTLTFAES